MSPIAEHSSLKAQCRAQLERSLAICDGRFEDAVGTPKLPELSDGEYRYVRIIIQAYRALLDEIPHATESPPGEAAKSVVMRTVSSEDLRSFLKAASEAQLT